ncbi:hypothetical protein BGX38DRAFT_1333338 [Terfezia claveryi]|nr:hypothetical protein BGX38DRAFT_1333338 [Terfezia claveryi]
MFSEHRTNNMHRVLVALRYVCTWEGSNPPGNLRAVGTKLKSLEALYQEVPRTNPQTVAAAGARGLKAVELLERIYKLLLFDMRYNIKQDPFQSRDCQTEVRIMDIDILKVEGQSRRGGRGGHPGEEAYQVAYATVMDAEMLGSRWHGCGALG